MVMILYCDDNGSVILYCDDNGSVILYCDDNGSVILYCDDNGSVMILYCDDNGSVILYCGDNGSVILPAWQILPLSRTNPLLGHGYTPQNMILSQYRKMEQVDGSTAQGTG